MKSRFNIGFWESVYEDEKAGIKGLLKSKALKLKDLESVDILNLKESQQQKHFSTIKAIEKEINIILGFLLITDEMKKQYWGSLDELIKQNDLQIK